ncbi:acetyl-CoA hydrolase/transferase family protein [Sphingomonas colocasiae]|uniref:Acetyl-CoA hydrolase n=1 Tax=Sphingomonas colocasiae TaxID=1848973 RepID=A0ABS7PL58_9SPHN|nr:acetyl-CoA hydrolase/transferase C-terminal domain-containing protein [Sphingomonas colocasiae]MBY8821704.1 acetyl-CoA hydrolase [Sphingomonas colocasiae]
MTRRLPDADAIDWAGILKPGETVMIGEGAGEPLTLAESLVAARHGLRDIRVFLGMTLAGTFRPEHADTLAFSSYGALGQTRKLADAGVLDILPIGLGQVPALVARGALNLPVVAVALSPPGPDGRHSFGLTAMHLPAAIRSARLVIAEVNHALPYIPGETIAASEIDIMIESERPAPELPAAAGSRTVEAIARHAARFIGDGASLQLGVGAIPEAICRELADRRDLGIHSGLLSPSLARLIEQGVATGKHQPIVPGRAVFGAVMGDRALYDFVRGNAALHLAGIETTHGRAAEVDNLVAINGALGVDLYGQVNAELAGRRHVGAIGGQAEFSRAGTIATRGRSIIALAATSPDGRRSTISAAPVPRVTTSRADVDIVVTEYGAAELAGCGEAERRRRLIAIAAPAFRDPLSAGEDRTDVD